MYSTDHASERTEAPPELEEEMPLPSKSIRLLKTSPWVGLSMEHLRQFRLYLSNCMMFAPLYKACYSSCVVAKPILLARKRQV